MPTTLSLPAQSLLDAYDQARSVHRPDCGVIDSLSAAGQIQDEIVAARVARGEIRRGFKIGFTNRTIWARYGVHHPIWGPVYDTTIELLDHTQSAIQVSHFAEPRLEPEIVVRLASVPADASLIAIADSIEWIAHGFEIVQSHFADWRFSGAESFAAQGLHGALLIGPRFNPDQLCERRDQLADWLAQITVALYLNDQAQAVDQGVGSNVLDGPLHAIAHLITELARNGRSLQSGDIITTGTITDAQPLLAGQRWRSELGAAGPLAPLQLSVDP